MFTVFYRVVLLASIGLVLGGTGAVYSTKYDARAAAKRLSELRHDIAQEEEKISVLRAEWSLLNQPSRLEDLSSRFLAMQPMGVEQLSRIDDLPIRLPALGAPNSDEQGVMVDSVGDLINALR